MLACNAADRLEHLLTFRRHPQQVAASVASPIQPLFLTGSAPYPIPFGATDASRHFVEHADTVRGVAFLQFGAAIPPGPLF